MDNAFLDQFALPEGASDAIRKQNLQPSRLQDGVNYFVSEHDRGVPYRFFVYQDRNIVKSKIAGYPIFDEIEMIEWQKDRFDHPTERVKFLPEELLAFDEEGVCQSGRFRESYIRFKNGLQATGTPLGRWGVLSDNEIATLTAMNIYSVEQFAAQPRTKIVGKLPQEIVDAFEQAIEWVKGKDIREAGKQQATQILAVSQENSKLKDELEMLKEQMKALMNADVPAPKKRGRPRKEDSEGIEESEE